MARLIDAEKAKFFIADVLDIFKVPVGDRMADRLLKTIDAIPTVDAVEVVRCKDCKKSMVNPFMTENPNMVCTRLWNNYVVKPDDFCSYGERKDNG